MGGGGGCGCDVGMDHICSSQRFVKAIMEYNWHHNVMLMCCVEMWPRMNELVLKLTRNSTSTHMHKCQCICHFWNMYIIHCQAQTTSKVCFIQFKIFKCFFLFELLHTVYLYIFKLGDSVYSHWTLLLLLSIITLVLVVLCILPSPMSRSLRLLFIIIMHFLCYGCSVRFAFFFWSHVVTQNSFSNSSNKFCAVILCVAVQYDTIRLYMYIIILNMYILSWL